MKYKNLAEKALKKIEELDELIEKYGRGDNGVITDGLWTEMWYIKCDVKFILEDLKQAEEKLKSYVIEKVARKILIDKNISLKDIIEKYSCDEY